MPGQYLRGTQSIGDRFDYSGFLVDAPTKGGIKMKARQTTIEIRVLDANDARCALVIDGLIRYVGSRDECHRRAEILVRRGDRERQNQMLARALR